MDWQNAMRSTFLVVSLGMLVACASNEAKLTSVGTNGDEDKPGSSTNMQQAVLAQAMALPNPSVIHFEKMAIALDESARQGLPLLAERARLAKKVTITGFCDAKEIGNPGDAAVARAIAVRDELVGRGVPTTSILVKFNTRAAKRHAAEVRFD
ncbi:MAG: hypothetical protein D3M94_19385 [Rhodocyclales bacterium GT-UBC]|nr:MAG: hypothetical protein D3M94_19385 [Rhodocyclales bacterium GT-UBC]